MKPALGNKPIGMMLLNERDDENIRKLSIKIEIKMISFSNVIEVKMKKLWDRF
jgi:hypothetical protein